MNKTKLAALGLAAAIVLLSFRAVGAGRSTNYAIEWQVLNGGGALVTAGDVTMSGSLGQTAIGLSTNGNVGLGAGYWFGVGSAAPGPPGDRFVYIPIVFRNQ
jgi:hypothetical protein